uniref:Uncharacterized protein n=1 Tax=Mycena chlorophos TaxID=658473 RepID=A0ABQ0KXH9_MYCCL|nr:predicted protein [Mycena chlorophos]
MFDDLYYESKPYKQILEFRRWTTPSANGEWGQICVHYSLIVGPTQLRCDELSWINDSSQPTIAIERGAVVRFVVQLQRVDQPISVASDGEVLLWRVSWKITARHICRLLSLSRSTGLESPNEVIATPQDEEKHDSALLRMPQPRSSTALNAILVA